MEELLNAYRYRESEERCKEISPSPINIYDKNKAWGLYTSVDIHDCHPEFIRNEDKIKEYISQLSDIMEMKCCGAPQIKNVGSDSQEEGCSITQFIEASLLTGHFTFKSNKACIDIFSSRYYDPEVISHFTLSYFKGSSYKVNVTVRK